MTDTWLPETSLDNDDEGYHLDVDEVAELLGVTRTRVSQLTSSGQLSFERRRVGSRNRLFYRRGEVLAHQRTFYGRHLPGSAPVSFRARPELSHQHENHVSSADISDPRGSRAGASGSVTNRAISVWPEHLLLELSKLLAREQSNTDLLVKLRELSLQIRGQVSAAERKALPSAVELAFREQSLTQFKTLARAFDGIRSQFHAQEQQLGLLTMDIAELKKLLLQLKNEQLKNASACPPRMLSATEVGRSFAQEFHHAWPQPGVENELQQKRKHPRVARTSVRKQIFKR